MTIRSTQQLIKLFETKTVIVLEEMQEALNSASRATVFRHLMKVNYRRSYNYNGKYYTKHDISRYDIHGLFSYKGIYFSSDGNLVETILRIVCESPDGKTQRELQDLLQVRVQASLYVMIQNEQLSRAKIDGCFIYIHPAPENNEAQLARRREVIEERRFAIESVTDYVVIQVLLILIRHPGSRVGDVARRLKGHSPPITIKHVQVVFERYKLDDAVKKKSHSKR